MAMIYASCYASCSSKCVYLVFWFLPKWKDLNVEFEVIVIVIDLIEFG